MSVLIERIYEHGKPLTNREFKVLVAMALSPEGDPPAYVSGLRRLLTRLNEDPESEPANRNVKKTISSLIDKGFLRRIHRGGFYENAQYEFVFPTWPGGW